MAKMNCYVVENLLTGSHTGIYLYRSDAYASRVLADVARRVNPELELSELRLKRIGTFDDETLTIISNENVTLGCPAEVISWNCRGRLENASSPVPVTEAESDMETIN